MKTMMIRLLPMGKIGRLAVIWLAAVLAALVLGGCGPQTVWVNPAKDQQEAELDMAECQALALTRALPFPTAEQRWQAEEAFFSACMRGRGHTPQEKEAAKPGE